MKKTFVYYLSIKELYGDEYIKGFIDKKYIELYNQLYIQFGTELSTKEVGFIIIPVTSGIERLEILNIG